VLISIRRLSGFFSIRIEFSWSIGVDKIASTFVYFATVSNFRGVRFCMWKNSAARFGFTHVIDLERLLDEIRPHSLAAAERRQSVRAHIHLRTTKLMA